MLSHSLFYFTTEIKKENHSKGIWLALIIPLNICLLSVFLYLLSCSRSVQFKLHPSPQGRAHLGVDELMFELFYSLQHVKHILYRLAET